MCIQKCIMNSLFLKMQVLTAQRDLFMSEQVILQYIGFVRTHMNIIKKGKHAGKPREGKILYHVSDWTVCCVSTQA